MSRVRGFWRLVVALLRELADESAYQRHLAAHGRTHSRQEWNRFAEQRMTARFVRPRCC